MLPEMSGDKMREFQSPSLRGSGRFNLGRATPLTVRRVSIPFIAGQWSLRVLPALKKYGIFGFQSPSLRGSGRFFPPSQGMRCDVPRFNPLHCGAVVASRDLAESRIDAVQVSIPFIAGQWSLHAPCRRQGGGASGFNPLHCGAVVASSKKRTQPCSGVVSIPFIAGQWSLHSNLRAWRNGTERVSIPFIAGQWSLPGSYVVWALPH